MANSKFEYVRSFEQNDILLPNTWIVVRVDGRAFTKMCSKYGFEKPNDRRALDLMNAAATAVVKDLPDITISYGVSDEYSFVFHKSCCLFERRSRFEVDAHPFCVTSWLISSSKLVSTVVSTFTANYMFSWPSFFPETPLTFPLPTFDGRAVCYPSIQNLRDYLSWRQVDCHINNLFNTTFWALVQLGGLDAKDAEKALTGTLSSDKNEILFSRFNINYNNEPEMFKKGSVIFRDYELVDPKDKPMVEEDESHAASPALSKTQAEKQHKRRSKAGHVVGHLDIIKDDFWLQRPWILTNKPGLVPKEI